MARSILNTLCRKMASSFFNSRGDAKHALAAVEAAIGYQDMAVGIESEEVTKGLDGDDCTGNGILLRYCLLEEDLQGFPGAAAKIGEELSIIQGSCHYQKFGRCAHA